MASKTVSGPLSSGRHLLFENPIIAAILLRLVADTVTTKTHDAYAWKVKQLGGHSFMCFALHLANEVNKPCRPPDAKGYSPLFREATSTLRHLKSACIHIALIHNEPWSAEDSAFADLLVRGYEGQNTQPRRRAGLSVPQLQAFLAEARERGYYDVADGALVQWAACARPRDMDALCLDRTIVFEDNHFAMFIEQKKRRADKMREGPDVLRLIQSETAQQIMKIRYETFREYGAKGSDLFFPGYTTKRVSEVLAFVAARDKWPEGLCTTVATCSGMDVPLIASHNQSELSANEVVGPPTDVPSATGREAWRASQLQKMHGDNRQPTRRAWPSRSASGRVTHERGLAAEGLAPNCNPYEASGRRHSEEVVVIRRATCLSEQKICPRSTHTIGATSPTID
jgi:hypothetical protein